MFIIKNKYLLLLLIFIPVLTFAQDVKFYQTKTSLPDTIKKDSLHFISADSLKNYEIIYEYDTIYQTKTIIDHDTIVLVDSLEKKIFPDTLKTFLSNTEKEKHFSVGLYFSTFTFSNNLSVKDQSAITYMDFRKIYEKPLPSYSLAITQEYKFNKWSIQSGVQYSLMKNKYDYPFLLEEYIYSTYMQDSSYYVQQNDTIDWYYQVTGIDTTWIPVINHEWVTVHDTVTENIIDTAKEERVKKGYQYLHFIEIPLIFSYEFVHYKKFSFEIKTGVIASFLIYRKGEIISYKGAQTFISLSDYPFVATSFSGYVGLGINYEISKKVNFKIQPYYQKSFSSILRKNFPVSQIPDKKGVCVGFQFKF